MRLSLAEVLEATGGGVRGGTELADSFLSFHTDSRQVRPGGLFFALKGAQTDGHAFIGDAAQRGAAGVVVCEDAQVPGGVAEVVVGDSWRALYDLAGFALRRTQPLVVGVTGSNGKTTTKEMMAAVLGLRHRVLKTEGNLNTETGVQVALGLQDAVAEAEDSGHHLLGRGLAVAAGDADHQRLGAPQREAREVVESAPAVPHHHLGDATRNLRVLADHNAGGAPLGGVDDESVAVGLRSLEREEQAPGAHLPGVGVEGQEAVGELGAASDSPTGRLEDLREAQAHV